MTRDRAIRVLGAMPLDCPPLVVVQHMPAGFSATFARRFDKACQIEVREAQDGDSVDAGCALIAAGDRPLVVVQHADGYCVQFASGPPVSRHRPSVDVLFQSVATSVGANAVGVLMTGMGADGAQGLFEMREAGVRTIAQDLATCVVYGMPKEAVDLEAVETLVPLPLIAQAILAAARETDVSLC